MSDFDNLELVNFLYSIENNILKKPEKRRNHFQCLEQDIITFDNLESELLDPLEKNSLEINSGNIKTLRQSKQA